jgi:peptidoglycan/xylan/chitin deacetylase (PgdA/CDA1 family)
VANRRSVALSFDDGPSESTPELLDLLSQWNIPATFFQCGAHVRRLPGVAKEIVARGHEAGNHTDTHRMLYGLTPAAIRSELRRAQESISEIAGTPPLLFRAPYGVRWFGLRGAQRELGLLGVMWTVIGLDWKLTADRITTRLTAAARPGAILCLHDGREMRRRPEIGPTLEAVRRVVPLLLSKGYRFETVSQILCPTSRNV